jgi:hypothetical protein
MANAGHLRTSTRCRAYRKSTRFESIEPSAQQVNFVGQRIDEVGIY